MHARGEAESPRQAQHAGVVVQHVALDELDAAAFGMLNQFFKQERAQALVHSARAAGKQDVAEFEAWLLEETKKDAAATSR